MVSKKRSRSRGTTPTNRKEKRPRLRKEEDKEKDQTMPTPMCYVYILESTANANHSYVGFTVNPERRLRQHNKELVGGAKYTGARGPWRFAAIISATASDVYWFNKIVALQCEWALKHCRSKWSRRQRADVFNRRRGMGLDPVSFIAHPAITRRINDLFHLLHSKSQWTRNAPPFTSQSLTIRLSEPFLTDEVRNRIQKIAYWNPVVEALA